MRYIAFLLLLVCMAAMVVCCSVNNLADTGAMVGDGDTLYLAHNLWYEYPEKIEALNCKGFEWKLPIGTPVRHVRIDSSTTFTNRWRYRTIITLQDGRTFLFAVNKAFQSNKQRKLSVREIVERTFTEKTVDELTAGLKEQEIYNIMRGTIQRGMSKRAVLLSWGYPPLHQTPELDHYRWIYWKSSMIRVFVEFDEQDRVKSSTWYGFGGNPDDAIE